MTRLERFGLPFCSGGSAWFIGCLTFGIPWEAYRVIHLGIFATALLLTILILLHEQHGADDRVSERVFVSGL